MKTPKPPPAGLVDNVVLLLVAGHTPDQIKTAAAAQAPAAGKKPPTPAALEAALVEARRRLALAAEVDQVEALGLARRRLAEVYRKALSEDDMRSALAALRELHKLERLHTAAPRRPARPAENVEPVPTPPPGDPDPLHGLRITG